MSAMEPPAQWSEADERAQVWPGSHQPLGATWGPEATNFAVHAPEATAVRVCLLDDPEDSRTGEPAAEQVYELTERTLGIWHGAVPGVAPGRRYGFRAEGPWTPERGLRFDAGTLLLDPYAQAVSGDPDAGEAASVVVADDFDWAGDTPPGVSWTDTVVYELHVKGFTARHDRVPEHLRGSYAGLAHPAVTDYLRELGVTTVELMPVHQFRSEPPLVDQGLTNYWGYNSIGFLAPHGGYSSSGDRGEQVGEFKAMVKALHAAGLEVVLDVVYNHTAEGGEDGPVLSFRGLDDRGYYKHLGPVTAEDTAGDGAAAADPAAYWDATGCGNTLDVSNPPVLRLVLDSLRYWVTEMHVDGFRFDLAPALARTGHAVDMRSHFLTAVGQDPVLRHVKLIAEPWDATPEGYRVGGFPPPWCEWNDRYRDTMRDFWRGASTGVGEVATRLAGSSDLYADDGRSPYASVNLVTAHDGFTLRDLVSYETKNNGANGQDGTDGTDDHRSWNCGVEGETRDPHVLALRHRQAANLMLTLCLSSGVPMITAGDERGRTQGGNNNAYTQDNEVSWVDWRPEDAWLDLYELTRTALALRRAHPALRQRHHLEGAPAVTGGPKDLAWFHPEGREMTEADWFDDTLRTLGMFVSGDPLRAPGPQGEQLHDTSFMLWFHAGPEPCEVLLADNPWVQTGEVVLSTDDALPAGHEVKAGQRLSLAGRSVLVLRAR